METHAELFEALLKGKKIKKSHWLRYYIYMNEDGSLVDQRGNPSTTSLDDPEEWEIFTPPKPKERRWRYVCHLKGEPTPGKTHEYYLDDEEFLKLNDHEAEDFHFFYQSKSTREFEVVDSGS